MSVKVHSDLLKMRSSVFSAMLQGTNKEALEGKIEIADFNEETIEAAVAYLYDDNCWIVSEDYEDTAVHQVVDLAAFANKYNIVSLLEECENRIISHFFTTQANIEAIWEAMNKHNLTRVQKFMFNRIQTQATTA